MADQVSSNQEPEGLSPKLRRKLNNNVPLAMELFGRKAKGILLSLESESEDVPQLSDASVKSRAEEALKLLQLVNQLMQAFGGKDQTITVPRLYGQLANRREAGLRRLFEYQVETMKFTPSHILSLKTRPLSEQLHELNEHLRLIHNYEIFPTPEELELLGRTYPKSREAWFLFRKEYFKTQPIKHLIAWVSKRIQQFAPDLEALGIDVKAIRQLLMRLHMNHSVQDLETLAVCETAALQIKRKSEDYAFSAWYDKKAKAWDVTWSGYFEGVRILEPRKSKSLRTVFECLCNASWDSNAHEGVVDLRGVTKAIYPEKFKIAQYQLDQELDKRGIDTDGARSGYANEVRMNLEKEIWARQNKVTIRAIKEGIRRGLNRIQEGVPNTRKVQKAVGELVVAKGQRIVTKLSPDEVSVRIP